MIKTEHMLFCLSKLDCLLNITRWKEGPALTELGVMGIFALLILIYFSCFHVKPDLHKSVFLLAFLMKNQFLDADLKTLWEANLHTAQIGLNMSGNTRSPSW